MKGAFPFDHCASRNTYRSPKGKGYDLSEMYRWEDLSRKRREAERRAEFFVGLWQSSRAIFSLRFVHTLLLSVFKGVSTTIQQAKSNLDFEEGTVGCSLLAQLNQLLLEQMPVKFREDSYEPARGEMLAQMEDDYLDKPEFVKAHSVLDLTVPEKEETRLIALSYLAGATDTIVTFGKWLVGK